jgi:hypothetical protein
LTIICRPSSFRPMDDLALLDEIKAYCAAARTKPSTLGLKALGNSRFAVRLERKIVKATEDAATIRAFMRDNPPDKVPASRRK